MKIGIITDTHENLEHIEKAVSFFNENNVEIVFHAGDIISPITFVEFRKLRAKFIGVFGNNDGEKFYLKEKFSPIGNIYEDSYETSIDGIKLVMYHKPICHNAILLSNFYDIIIYGHTHEIDIRAGQEIFKPEKKEFILQTFKCNNTPIIVNPGECCSMLTGMSSAVIFDTETKEICFKYLYIDPKFHK